MKRSHPLIRRMANGSLAGLAATIPMTGTMLTIQELLPRGERVPQEPQLITDELLRRFGLLRNLSPRQRALAGLVSHFGYGALAGTVGALLKSKAPVAGPTGGAAYGLLVWGASYAAWLPALRILPPPNHWPRGRNVLLITSHLVWGAALDFVIDRLEPPARAPHAAVPSRFAFRNGRTTRATSSGVV